MRQRKDVEEGRVFMCCSLCYCASVCLSLLQQAFASVPLCVGANAYISPSLSLVEYDRWRWHDRARDDERERLVRALHAPTCKTIISIVFFSQTFKISAWIEALFCLHSGQCKNTTLTLNVLMSADAVSKCFSVLMTVHLQPWRPPHFQNNSR